MNFWEELAQARIEEEVPKGWLTTKEIAKEMGLGETQAGRIIRQAVADGKVDVRPFKLNRSGVVRPIPHYKKK